MKTHTKMARIFVTFLIFLFAGISVNAQALSFAEEINLSEGEIQIFIKKTSQKIDEFQEYIIILASKEETRERKDMSEKAALKLFYPGAIIKITTTDKQGSKKEVVRTIAEYLYRLKILPFKKVNIDFYDIAYVTTFKKGPDGKYYGTATIFQKFTGFQGDNMVYESVTKKEIEVILENVEDEFYGEKRWKIFLGDIKATETTNS
ncbi:MAG: hypothetical protein JXB49_26245 [Bacteroidales bacterium]|nr:hypothetical protein [Bacteroidales bacterium]